MMPAFGDVHMHRTPRDETRGRERQREIDEIQSRIEIEQAERQRETLRLETERLRMEMEHKKQKLNALALHLMQRSELLESVKSQIERAATSGGDEKAPALNE